MKLVLEFTKSGSMIFISHLDLMRLFLRVLRMSGLRPDYSQGFNPHPKMSFVMPLSLGMYSTCELLEFEISEGIGQKGDINLAGINERFPEGIRITSIWEKPLAVKKPLASYAAAAVYEFMCEGIFDAPGKLAAFFERKTVTARKIDKKAGLEIEKEIRPGMLGYRIVKDIRGRMLAETTLAATPGLILNPLVFFGAFCKASGLETSALTPVITRTAILSADGRALKEILK